jgi:tRNA (mo5U34)-methyltransferase
MRMKSWRSSFYESIVGTDLEKFIDVFANSIKGWEKNVASKDVTKWQKQLAQLPKCVNVKLNISSSVALVAQEPLTKSELLKTTSVLKNFMPWRKGPFDFFSIHIDTEWHSDWKWNRVLPHITDLKNKKVLDVGCGSGYHLFRMHGCGASQVVGIDPTLLFFYQFHCFKQYLNDVNIHFLPIGIEAMPPTGYFDSVFSMGVLYHRPDPIKFLRELKAQLSENGELILETLVIEGDENSVLMPTDRYAQMRNIWFIPSVKALTLWMKRVGFVNIKCVDIDDTSVEEQRATQWMQNHSLVDFLDPLDRTKTIEGYPAPKRAVIVAS